MPSLACQIPALDNSAPEPPPPPPPYLASPPHDLGTRCSAAGPGSNNGTGSVELPSNGTSTGAGTNNATEPLPSPGAPCFVSSAMRPPRVARAPSLQAAEPTP
jgi:hypothetical protein